MVAFVHDIISIHISVSVMIREIGNRVEEFAILILGQFITRLRVITCANLSAADGHLGVAQHVAAHATAIDRAFHQCRVGNGHIGFAHSGHQVEKRLVVMT